MKVKKLLMAIGVAAILSMSTGSFAGAADLVVVATAATFANAAEWTTFLKSKSIPVKNVAPADLAGFKDAPYVVIMGGMDEAEGIKPLVEKAVTKKDFEWINKAGNSRMYVKSNVWSGGQEVIIFAGADGAGAEMARKRNRAEWWEFIREWFRIDEGESTGGKLSY